MLRLKQKGIPTREFPQTVPGMTAASQLLYDLFKNKNIEAYPDDELRRHIQMAVAETNSRGFRIVKSKVSKRHYIDGAVALAMAAYEAVNQGGVDISIPVVIESPFSDATAWNVPAEETKLPFALQSD
jgi:phage terminase large subunit-like protein